MIENSGGILDYFGYWPLFCDARIERFSFAAPGTVGLSLCYIDADKNKRATIDLLFSGVTNMALTELRAENVIDELSIRQGAETVVHISAAYGLCGAFSCIKSEVVHVTYAGLAQA